MKKYYLNLSFVALLVATVFFSNSCGKKSSDPAPAETPTTPTANVKEVPRDIKTKEPAKDGDGTVRTTGTNVTTNGTTVVVQAPTSSFKTSMSGTGQTNLGTLLGTTNARLSGTFDFGWFITIVNSKITRKDGTDTIVNLAETEDSSTIRTVMFFDSENPGIYYQYYYELDKKETGNEEFWDWGTYAVDKDMKTIAFDFNANNVPESIWDIKFMTNSNIVLKTNVDVPVEGITYSCPTTVSMFGFDLQSGLAYKDTPLQQELASAPWYLSNYITKGAVPSTCPNPELSYLFFPNLSYFAGTPLPCGTASEGYYYIENALGVNKIVMYYPEYVNDINQPDTDLTIEATVTTVQGQGLMTLTYTKCIKIPSYVGYVFNYTTSMPTSSSTLTRK